MHARKTGALIRAAAVAGAIMAGGSDDEIRAVDEYGRHLGLAFQIVDDILDVEGDAKDLGKTAGKDAKAGKPTYPSMYGLDASRRLAAERHDDALAALRSPGCRRPPRRHRRVGRQTNKLTFLIGRWQIGRLKQRLDVLLVQRGLAPSRERASALILSGVVLVNGQPAQKAGMPVPTTRRSR